MNGSFRFCFHNFHFRSLSFGIGLWFLPKNSANRSTQLDIHPSRKVIENYTVVWMSDKNHVATFRTSIIFIFYWLLFFTFALFRRKSNLMCFFGLKLCQLYTFFRIPKMCPYTHFWNLVFSKKNEKKKQ